MLLLILLAVHTIAILYLGRVIWFGKKEYNLPITIYNIPTILLTIGALLAACYVSIIHFIWSLPVGLILAVICWYLYLEDTENKSRVVERFIVTLLTVFLWPEMLVFLIYYALNSDKIDAYEESEP